MFFHKQATAPQRHSATAPQGNFKKKTAKLSGLDNPIEHFSERSYILRNELNPPIN
jgi:hypothetical protein